MKKTEKLEVALVLKRRSEEDRTAGLALPVGTDRSHKLSTQLYNAATAFGLWQDSNGSGDFDQMLDFTNNLEEAAMAFAMK